MAFDAPGPRGGPWALGALGPPGAPGPQLVPQGPQAAKGETLRLFSKNGKVFGGNFDVVGVTVHSLGQQLQIQIVLSSRLECLKVLSGTNKRVSIEKLPV